MIDKPSQSPKPTLAAGVFVVLLVGMVIVVGLGQDVPPFVLAQEDETAAPPPTATWRGPVVGGPTGTPFSPGTVPPPTDSAVHGAAPPPLVEAVAVPDGAGSDGTLRRIAVPILMYHYVSEPPEDADIYRLDLSVPPDRFRAQMQYLADYGYSVIGLDDLNLALRWGLPLPDKPVVLTFDDGYADAYSEAFPILQEFGYTATFFVIASRLDAGHAGFLTWAQAAEMAAAGMDIENHSKDHLDLRQRSPDFLYYQIQGAAESIAAHTGQMPRFFCYPAGRWDESTLAALQALDVWAAVTTEGGIDHTTDATLLMERVRISGETDLETFAVLLEWSWDRADG